MKKSEEPAGAHNPCDLELPDWSGMDDSSPRITPEAAFRLCEQYPRLFGKRSPNKRDDRHKTEVEFRL